MPLFVRASANGIDFAGPNKFQNFDWGTLVAIARTPSSTLGQTLLANNKADNTDYGFGWGVDGSAANFMGLWSATANTSAVEPNNSFTDVNVFCLHAVTKTSGATTVRFHELPFNGGTWAHTNAFSGSTTLADNVDFGPPVRLGDGNIFSDGWDGEISAVMAIPHYAMSDLEVERMLPAGRWASLLMSAPGTDDFLADMRRPFPAGVNAVRSMSGGRETATTTTGAGPASAFPTGWRHSIETRRR